MLRIVPPAPAISVDVQGPVLSRKVATVFVPADSKREVGRIGDRIHRPDRGREATASPVAIVTSELAPGTPAGLQLSGVVPIRTDGARPCRFAHDASPYPDCHAMPARGDGAAAGSDELHQRAGPAVGGEGETRVRIVAGHLDIGGQTQTRVGQGERAARPRQYSRRNCTSLPVSRKFVASIVSPVPKPLIVAAKDCACLSVSASAPVSLMVCPAETLESN